MVCYMICLIFSKVIEESKEAILPYLDAILALVLQHYHNCIVEKVLPAYSAAPVSLLCHLFPCPSRKMPGLEWESGGGASTVSSLTFQSFHLIPLEILIGQSGTTGILSLLGSVPFPAGMLPNVSLGSTLPSPMKG